MFDIETELLKNKAQIEGEDEEPEDGLESEDNLEGEEQNGNQTVS